MEGRAIGVYRLVRELGRGGMGVVYEVRRPEIPRPLALKLILEGAADPEALARFGREAELLARVRHPNVVVVHELGRAPEGPFLVSERVEGQGLDERLRAGPLSPRQAATLVRALADALVAVHAQGVVHRDLKPANVIVRPDGTPVLLDFGLARELDAQTLTHTGATLGTPAYMAPEQAAGERALIDARCDVWGLGAVLFACLTGEPPFAGSGVQVLHAVLFGEPAWERLAAAPSELAAVCRAALARERLLRYPSAEALRDDLDRFLAGEPVAAAAAEGARRARARRRGRLVAGVALLLLLGAVAGGLAWWGHARAARLRVLEETLARAEAVQQPRDRARELEIWLATRPGWLEDEHPLSRRARAAVRKERFRAKEQEAAGERLSRILAAGRDAQRAELPRWLATYRDHPRRGKAEAELAAALRAELGELAEETPRERERKLGARLAAELPAEVRAEVARAYEQARCFRPQEEVALAMGGPGEEPTTRSRGLFLSDGRALLVGGHRVQLRAPVTGPLGAERLGRVLVEWRLDRPCTAVALAPGEAFALLCVTSRPEAADGQLLRLELDGRQAPPAPLAVRLDRHAEALAFASARVVLYGEWGGLTAVDLASGAPLAPATSEAADGQRYGVWDLASLGDGRVLAVGGGGERAEEVLAATRTLQMWSAEEEQLARVWTLGLPHQARAVVHDEARGTLVWGDNLGVLSVAPLGARAPRRDERRPLRREEGEMVNAHPRAVTALAYARGLLFSSTGDPRSERERQDLVAWDLASGRELFAVRDRLPRRARSLAIAPDGRWLLRGTSEGVVELWPAWRWGPDGEDLAPAGDE